MPYIVSLTPRSPYIPRGITVPGFDPGPLFKPITIDGEFIASAYNSGTPIDPELLPQRVTVDVKAEALPDIFSLKYGYGVTDRIREKVEELEPGVHQFFPVEITAKGGERPNKRHWLLNICNRVDAADPEKTGLQLRSSGHSYNTELSPPGHPMDLVLCKEAIAGKCMWIDRKLPTKHFFSDELFEFVQENKMTKFDSWKVEAV